MRPRDALAQRSLIDAPATWKILVNSRKGDESQRVIRFWISRLEVLRIRLFVNNYRFHVGRIFRGLQKPSFREVGGAFYHNQKAGSR